MNTFLDDVEAFLIKTGMSPTKFGHEAKNDRHLVRKLREGRECRRKTENDIRAFMANWLVRESDSVN